METGLSAAIGGVTRAFEVNSQRAQRIAASAPEGDSFVKDMAELPSDPIAVKANMAAVKTQDQMLGALMDMFA